MKCIFICAQRKLFELSTRVEAPALHIGELVRWESQLFAIADIEHDAILDGGQDRARLQTRVHLRRLSEEEAKMRISRRLEEDRDGPARRY